ncbi:hypothetical protein M9H77_10662 [Catharanthus roseus]|uniref:Uncharacterized protein n=1 Tax=Catharanthus roseus TaxID=4058 RepID=A0ACC0BCK9_CATRO|nr:hypothetical protein M9H77_10662 [Catharanthus roseus]
MEHIVGNEEEHNDDDNRVEFPKLETLELGGMPAFRSFYSAFNPEDTARNTMLNHQVTFPCLEKVDVYNMKNLTQVVDGQMLSCSLCKVGRMSVSNCENLLVVAASDMGSLQKLEVSYCESLEAVFSFEGNQATLGQLDYLILKNLPKLVEISKIPPPGNGTFQNLRYLRVEKCKNLRFLLPFHVAKMLVKIQKITIKQCETMEGVIGKTDRVVDDDAELALFPDLETLELQDLPMLEMFSSGSLRRLDIAGCPKWKIFHKAPISDAKSIETSNLKTSEGPFFHQKVKFPDLEILFISGKEVEMLRDEEHQYAAPDKLRELHITDCDLLLYAICINDCWRNLEKLRIINCESLIKVFQLQGTRVENEPESTNADLQSSKHQLLKDSLCNLRQVYIAGCNKLLHVFPSTDQSGGSVFRNLTSLQMFYCDNVRYLLSPSIARALSSIQNLEIQKCKLIEEIVVRDAEDAEDEEEVDKLVLPLLETLILQKLENLKWFFHGDLDFPSLVDFTFNECPKMEVLCCGTLCTPKIVKDLNDTIRSKYRRETAMKNEAESSTTDVEDVEFEEAGRQER